MRLYYHPQSRCSQRVLLTASHLRLTLDLQVVDLFTGAHHAAPFLALNPNHRVPVLDDGGFIIWESFAIMQYLADATPGQKIYPTDAKPRADVNRWLFWCAQHFAPAMAILNWENAIKPMIGQGAPDPGEVARGERQFAEFGAVLDHHLATREWICGTAPTLAEYAIAAPMADHVAARFPVDGFPHLQRWFGRVTALDAWQRVDRSAPA